MYSSAAMRLPTNTTMVERGLNVAYERIRDVHNHLKDIEYLKEHINEINTLYEYLKDGIDTESEQSADTRLLGEVGKDDFSFTKTPPLIQLAHAVADIKLIAPKIEDIYRVSSKLNHVINVSYKLLEVEDVSKNLQAVVNLHKNMAELLDLDASLVPKIEEIIPIIPHLIAIQSVYNNLDALSKISTKLEPVIGLSKLPDGSFALEKGVQYVVLDELESDEEKFSYWGSIKNLILDTYPGTRILPNNTTTIFMDGTESQVFPDDYTPVNTETTIHVNDPDYTDPDWAINIIPDGDEVIELNPSISEDNVEIPNNPSNNTNQDGNTSFSETNGPSGSGGTMESEDGEF